MPSPNREPPSGEENRVATPSAGIWRFGPQRTSETPLETTVHSSFDYYSVMGGGTGTYQAAAHVQRIGAGEDSGSIGPVPEPTTGVLVGLGLIVAARRRARR